MVDSKKKVRAQITKQNVLESLKDLGEDTVNQTSDLLKSTSEDFFNELLGLPKQQKRSGEIQAGESVEMAEVLSGKEKENQKLKAQISLERQLSADESRVSKEKTNELRVQLQAIISEVQKAAVATQELTQEVQVAALQVPVEPGVYHLVFFQKLLEFLQSFRKKVEEAATWLHATNKRAEKKNYWNMYKKKGSSFLLSPDHYLQRSAG